MKLSVITATFNSEKTIEDTLDSVKKQDVKNMEHVVVDGGSKDATIFLVNQHNNSKVYTCNTGRAYGAMNVGIQKSTGDIISILNSDDVYFDKDVIKDVIDFFEKTNADMVYTHIAYINKDTNRICRMWKTGPIKKCFIWFGWIMPHPGVFVKKRVYDEINFYNPQFEISADYDFLLRIITNKKYAVHFFDRYTIKMRTGGISDLGIFKKFYEWHILARIFKKHYKIYPFWFFVTRPFFKINQFLIKK